MKRNMIPLIGLLILMLVLGSCTTTSYSATNFREETEIEDFWGIAFDTFDGTIEREITFSNGAPYAFYFGGEGDVENITATVLIGKNIFGYTEINTAHRISLRLPEGTQITLRLTGENAGAASIFFRWDDEVHEKADALYNDMNSE